ncbi:unnamed protein product [Ectocarpus sp. 12 AP-2014]
MEVAAAANHYDEMEDEIKARQMAISKAQAYPASNLERHGMKQPAGATAGSKLAAYRASTTAMTSHNRTTKRFLSPSGPSAQHASKLQRPQQYRSTSPTRAGSNASSPVGRGRGDANGNGERAGGDEYAGSDCSRDETIERLTKVLRTKNMEIKNLRADLKRCEAVVRDVDVTVENISSDSAETDMKIVHLADDLAIEKRSHQAAIENIERQSQRLTELEKVSTEKHEENMMLSGRLEEINHLAGQQEQRLQEARVAAAEAAAAAAAAEETAAAAEKRVEAAEAALAAQGGDGLEKELEKLRQGAEMKAKQLEAVQERASKTNMELQRYKGLARRGRFKRLLAKLWWLLRAIGFLGFLFFAYVAVSEGTFRSRGVDVYRLAH